jgi:hypothetical protein
MLSYAHQKDATLFEIKAIRRKVSFTQHILSGIFQDINRKKLKNNNTVWMLVDF